MDEAAKKDVDIFMAVADQELKPMLTFTEHPTAVQLRRFQQQLRARGASDTLLQVYENCDTTLYEMQPCNGNT